MLLGNQVSECMSLGVMMRKYWKFDRRLEEYFRCKFFESGEMVEYFCWWENWRY